MTARYQALLVGYALQDAEQAGAVKAEAEQLRKEGHDVAAAIRAAFAAELRARAQGYVRDAFAAGETEKETAA